MYSICDDQRCSVLDRQQPNAISVGIVRDFPSSTHESPENVSCSIGKYKIAPSRSMTGVPSGHGPDWSGRAAFL